MPHTACPALFVIRCGEIDMLGLRPLLALVWVLSLGCSRPIAPPTPAADPSGPARLAAADALLRSGCLDCLIEAFREYETLRSHPLVAGPATRGAIRAGALIALRDRELGTTEHGHMDRARELALAMPSAPPNLLQLLEIAEAMPFAGRPQVTDAQVAESLRYSRRREEWTAWLRPLAADDELFAYVWMRMGCESIREPMTGEEALREVGSLRDTPLIAFKEAISCSRGNTAKLQAILDREPRFREAHYFLGFAALGGQLRSGTLARPDLDAADRHFSAAYEWRPDWPALAIAIGGVAMTAEDFERSLLFYGRALELVPDQPDALLGETRALTYLGAHVRAIGAADRLLATGRFPGDARYWRALNEVNLVRLDDAWADVELAARMLSTPDVPKLAGIIAHRRRDLSVARVKFEEAQRLRPTDCEIGFYLQTVLAELRDWSRAIDVAATAAACFDVEETALQREVEELRAADMVPERRRRLVARREQQLAANGRMRANALFNAAAASFNAGRREEARAFADRVADDELFGPRAREILGRP
jgi:tetratricopeptide (TPR) repeat protein